MSPEKTSEIKPVCIYIMGNEYHVSSPEEQIPQLEAAAKELDRRMREIKASGKIIGIERIAVMAALNMTYEMQQDDERQLPEKVFNKINKLNQDIDSVLASNAQMELT